jgi:hypothetical protein
MKSKSIHITNCQYYTNEQAEQELKDKVSVLNYDILRKHITEPSLAEHIRGFEEQSGVLFLLIGDEMVSVTDNHSHPVFGN